jgi:hypothetical protein
LSSPKSQHLLTNVKYNQQHDICPVQVKVSDVKDKLDDDIWPDKQPVDLSIYELTTHLAAGDSFINMSSKLRITKCIRSWGTSE